MQVPFFSDDEETPSTPKADALFIPRENPRALVIRPTEQFPLGASAAKTSSLKDMSRVPENGKIQLNLYNFEAFISIPFCKKDEQIAILYF